MQKFRKQINIVNELSLATFNGKRLEFEKLHQIATAHRYSQYTDIDLRNFVVEALNLIKEAYQYIKQIL